MSPNKPLQLTWEELLTHFKRKFCPAENTLEIENQLLNLKNGSMTVHKYTNDFMDKMDFALCLITDELTKIDRYAKVLPWEYKLSSHLPLRWSSGLQSLEWMTKKRIVEKAEVVDNRKANGVSWNNNIKKKNKFSNSNKKFRSNQEGKWCDQCKKKHFGDCIVYFKCKEPGHISTKCLVKGKVCFKCGEEGYIKAVCPKVENQIPRFVVTRRPSMKQRKGLMLLQVHS